VDTLRGELAARLLEEGEGREPRVGGRG
jgi:hypothetical protein